MQDLVDYQSANDYCICKYYLCNIQSRTDIGIQTIDRRGGG